MPDLPDLPVTIKVPDDSYTTIEHHKKWDDLQKYRGKARRDYSQLIRINTQTGAKNVDI